MYFAEKLMRYLSFLVLSVVLFACSREPVVEEITIPATDLAAIADIKPLEVEVGEKMLTQHCYSCHNPQSVSHDEMLAPPLAGIKHRYLQSFPQREAFIYRMSAFVRHPTAEDALMRGPVRRFGLMPPLATLSADSVLPLIAFIYDNDLPVPEWFPEHFNEKHDQQWKGRKQ